MIIFRDFCSMLGLQIFGKIQKGHFHWIEKDTIHNQLHQLIGIQIRDVSVSINTSKYSLDVQNASFTILSISQDKRYLGLDKINNSKFRSNITIREFQR